MQLINLTTIVASLALVSAQEHYQNVQQSCQTMGYCTPTNSDPLQCYNCQLDLSIKNQVYNQANGFTQGQAGFIEPQTPPSIVPTQVPQPSQSSDSANPPSASSGSANPSTPTQSGDQPQPTPSSGSAAPGQSSSAPSSGSQPSGSASSSSGNKSSTTTAAGNNASMIGGSLVLGTLSLIASLFI
ncbi:hypothetical protein CONCODRAFT_77451 [Conidiobolus coronatus NRRL 28638]|uniref:Uncharacterized protein n=1 Tax=Conidiobolus coronatus (strain ATCC 28846 / CBS 209.66 / NRRL 28638) TaxID=796925 RepID=A0A137PEC9_CONC2|nr:hypothetical protein CONCODRAFT_77451 [Conidiobolus coronatus NRRL 28638]|eukprot:KXN73325.1 hypothetical protein CONCODRAFT_77451 [Conidiobolus coronatus NRRL 28638]